jgi:hypothetical protein
MLSVRLFSQVTSITGSYWNLITVTDTVGVKQQVQTTIIIDERPQYNKIEIHYPDGTIATYFIASKFVYSGTANYSLKNPESSLNHIDTVIVVPRIAVYLVNSGHSTIIITGVTALLYK